MDYKCMEEDTVLTGKCGENITWRLEGKTLIIEGTGEMARHSGKQWKPYCNEISNVVIGEGITSIAERAFMNCSDLISIIIPDSIKEIGSSAFLDAHL